MSSIYQGHTALTIELTTGIDLSIITSVEIEYRNPYGVLGSFPATIDDALLGVISYKLVDENDLGLIGTYSLWAKVVDSLGKVSIGAPIKITVKQKGE